jgi:anaerobic selenocysteine-containing dehydrogenase
MKPTEIGRREFLKMLGLAVSGTVLAGTDTVWAAPQNLIDEALRGPGIETFKNTICQLCPAGCGIRARLIDGVPVHLDGNPMHPINRGGICPNGSAGLDFQYHPDRLKGPVKRAGKRGEGKWAEISWNEALETVATRLMDIRKSGTPEQLAFFTDTDQGMMFELISRFMRAYGSNNLLVLDRETDSSAPFKMMFGWDETPEYDIENTKFILSMGANFLEEGASPVRNISAYGKMRENQVGGRARVVYVDPRHSLTAGSADEFIPIKPGTHGAFALGIAYVLIKEKHYDADFVHKNVLGFDSWVDERGEKHDGFRTFVLENYYPEKVAAITGAPARRIVEIAREFGRTRPALAMVGQAASDTTNGMFNAMAVLALNVFTGNIEKKGGIRFKRETPFKRFPKVPLDGVARKALAVQSLLEDRSYRFPFDQNSIQNFCSHVEAGDLYPINTLFVYGSDPAFDHPYAKRIRSVLEKIPFIVSFSTILDDTSEFADIILPNHSPFERWMDSGPTRGVHFAHAAVSQPVVAPFYDTRHAGDVLITIARKLGGNVSKAMPADDFVGALKERFRGVYASGEGSVISGSFEESWVQYLKQRGWQNLVYDSFDDFWKVLVERGGWWNPVEEEVPIGKALRTPTGKIELFCRSMAERTRELSAKLGRDRSQEETKRILLEKWKINEKSDMVFYPHFEEPRFEGEESEYPYVLFTFGVLTNRTGAGSFSPLLQEMFGYYRRVYWESWVELNPETARAHHLSEDDWVEVKSPEGAIKARVVFNEALDPGVVAVPFGMGHKASGRYAKGIGVNPYDILAVESDYLWGRPAKTATRVKIAKTRREIA